MTIRVGVVMDPIQSIHYKKDSTLAMLMAAQERHWEIYYFEQADLFLRDGIAYGKAHSLKVIADSAHWYELGKQTTIKLETLPIILMRKDPPFNENYIYSTYILEQAEKAGVLVVNRPQALRDANEKLFTAYFPACCPPTLVTQSKIALHEFWQEHHDIVCKPLNVMGGKSVFRLSAHDVNANVIFEMLTQDEKNYVMAQQFIPAIKEGDKRILLINGEPIPFALARVPSGNDWRGNLAVGATGIVQPLSARDKWICAQLGPELRHRGLYFVGIDVIGDYLTEINVTSPTGIQEISAAANLNVAKLLLDELEIIYRSANSR